MFYRNKVFGLDNIPNGAAIIAPNHTSYYDPPLISASLPEEAHYIARGSLFNQPILRTVIRLLNAHPVHGTVGDLGTFKLVTKLLKESEKVIIFPEGERSDDGSIGEIKLGIAMIALRADAPIIPTYLHGTYTTWPNKRLFPRPWGKLACVFGKPIKMDKFKDMNKKEAQEAVAQELKRAIKRLKYWYEDKIEGS